MSHDFRIRIYLILKIENKATAMITFAERARHVAWGDPMPEEQTMTHFSDREKRVLPLLARLAQRPNIRVVYPHLTFCDDVSCRYSKSGRPLYSDSNHLNAAGAAELGNMYADLFAAPRLISLHSSLNVLGVDRRDQVS
ncbi:SGNH hydrolase domain-containing protein [Hyphomicrobium sp.]|jgi:hypothetical protein|uniref:SGNH hydrolase domain-containing protein n=1 Tax=Hyphomicrobium sp. TaxID=82 RepID=UPI00356547D3